MDVSGLSGVSLGVMIYLMMFGSFLVPLLVFGYICLRESKSWLHKLIGLWAALTIFIGFGFYLTIDALEARRLQHLWWIGMFVIHSLPLLISGWVVVRHRKRWAP